MTKGKNVAKGNTKNDKAASNAPVSANVETANVESSNESAPADAEGEGESAPAESTAAESSNESTPADANAGTTAAPATPAAPAKKARIPLKGVTKRGGGGGGKRLGPVYNIAEVMYGHITSKTKDGAKETAVMHHIINGEAIFVKETVEGKEEVFIDFSTPGAKLYSFVANVNNKTARKTSIYKEVEADVPVLDKDNKPVMNADGTPKTTKAMVPAEGTAWHGFIVATPANAQKVYDNIKAMLTNPLTEGSELRKQITLLDPPFNLHDSAPATLDINTEVVEEGEGSEVEEGEGVEA